MKNDLKIVLGLLVVLTVITVFIFNSDIAPVVKNRMVILLSYIKILLVAFYFMELKKAHLFWKMSLTGLMGLIAIAICLL